MSLAAFSNTFCATCGEITLHTGKGCCHCETRKPPPVARDIASLTFRTQTISATQRRLARTIERNKLGREPRVYRSSTVRADAAARREGDVLRCMAQGISSFYAIARELSLTGAGVRGIVQRACRRLNVTFDGRGDHAALLEAARRRGLIDLLTTQPLDPLEAVSLPAVPAAAGVSADE